MKVNFKKRLLSTAVVAITVLGSLFAPLCGNVYAKETSDGKTPPVWLQISPVSSRVVLSAGEELTYLFNVDNIGSEDFTVKVYATPYSAVNEKYDLDFKTQTNRTQISRWLSFRANGTQDKFKTEATFDIKAGARQTVEYKITVPKSIPAGGQYAKIAVEYVAKEDGKSAGVQTIPGVSMVVYGATSGDTIEGVELSEHQLDGFLTSGEIHSSVLVKNTGNTDFSAKHHLEIKSLLGTVLYDYESDYDVLPETSRRIDTEWKDTPSFGIFRVTSDVTALKENSHESKLVLIVPLFLLIIIFTVLTILIIWLIIVIKKRQTRRSRVIV